MIANHDTVGVSVDTATGQSAMWLAKAVADILIQRGLEHFSTWRDWFPHFNAVSDICSGVRPARLDVALLHVLGRAHETCSLLDSEWEAVRRSLGVPMAVLRTRVLETCTAGFSAPDVAGRSAELAMVGRAMANQDQRLPISTKISGEHQAFMGLAAILESRRIEAMDLLQSGGFIARAIAESADGPETALVNAAHELNMSIAEACLALALAEASDRAPLAPIGRRKAGA